MIQELVREFCISFEGAISGSSAFKDRLMYYCRLRESLARRKRDAQRKRALGWSWSSSSAWPTQSTFTVSTFLALSEELHSFTAVLFPLLFPLLFHGSHLTLFHDCANNCGSSMLPDWHALQPHPTFFNCRPVKESIPG